ncbi:aa3-type cytochrome c oxidase subunit IV [Pseudochelatococcus sp. B33]
MAEDHVEMDYREHDRTYEGFIRLFKYGTVATAVVLILMAIFLL